MKCPHCGKTGFIPEVVERHAESYGGGYHHFRCLKCHKVVSASVAVKIVITDIRKSTKTEGDWG